MATHKRFFSSSGGVAPTGAYVVEPAPINHYARRRGAIAGTVFAVNNPVPVRNVGGITTAGDGNPLGNPNYSCAAGPEILPTLDALVPLDVGTAYIFQHNIPQYALGPNNRPVTEFAPFKDVQQHFVAYDLYRNVEAINDYVTPVKITLPIRSASTTGTGVTLTGAATALEALQTVGDGKYITLDATGTGVLKVAFDPTDLDTNWYTTSPLIAGGRITNMYLRYVVWKDDDSEPVPGEGFKLQWRDDVNVNQVEIGSYLVQNYRRFSTYETKQVGETNPVPRSKTSWPSYDLHPFTVQDIVDMSAATNRTFFLISPLIGDITQTDISFDFIELVVEVIPEGRDVAAIRNVSNASSSVAANGVQYTNTVAWRNPYTSSQTIALNGLDDYYLIVREARPADASDYYRTRTSGAQTVAPMEAYGPALQIRGVLQHRSADELYELGMKQILTYRSAVTDDQVADTTVELFSEYRLSVAHYNPTLVPNYGAFWASYRGMAGIEYQKVHTGKNVEQRVWLEAGQRYFWVRALVRPSSQVNGTISFQIYNQANVLVADTFTYTVGDLQEQGWEADLNGWYEILPNTFDEIIPLSDGWYTIVAVSDASTAQGWYVAAAEPTGMQPYFSYDVVPVSSATEDIIDYAMILACDPDGGAPEPTVTVGSFELEYPSCGITEAPQVEIEWVSDGQWDQYVIQYRTTNYNELTGSTFFSISKAITALPAGETHTYVFPSPPWDANTQYYIVGHRAFDLLQARSAASSVIVVPSPGAAFGISELGIENGNVAIYAPADSGEVEIQWKNLTDVEIITLHNVDGSIPLVPVEDRGYGFSVSVLVDQVGFCETPDNASMTGMATGSQAMDRSSWFRLKALADFGTVWVQFPGGRLESYIMQVGGMTAHTVHGVYMAELNFTKLTGINLELLGDDE